MSDKDKKTNNWIEKIDSIGAIQEEVDSKEEYRYRVLAAIELSLYTDWQATKVFNGVAESSMGLEKYHGYIKSKLESPDNVETDLGDITTTLRRRLDDGELISKGEKFTSSFSNKTAKWIISYLQQEITEIKKFNSDEEVIGYFYDIYRKEIQIMEHVNPFSALVLGVHDDTEICKSPIFDSLRSSAEDIPLPIKPSSINYPTDDRSEPILPPYDSQKAEDTLKSIKANIESDSNQAYLIFVGNTLGNPLADATSAGGDLKQSRRQLELRYAIKGFINSAKHSDPKKRKRLAIYKPDPGENLYEILDKQRRKLGDVNTDIYILNDLIEDRNFNGDDYYSNYFDCYPDIKSLDHLREVAVEGILIQETKIKLLKGRQEKERIKSQHEISIDYLDVLAKMSNITSKLISNGERNSIPGALMVIPYKGNKEKISEHINLVLKINNALDDMEEMDLNYPVAGEYPTIKLFERLCTGNTPSYQEAKDMALDRVAEDIANTEILNSFVVLNIRHDAHLKYLYKDFWPSIYGALERAYSANSLKKGGIVFIVTVKESHPIKELRKHRNLYQTFEQTNTSKMDFKKLVLIE